MQKIKNCPFCSSKAYYQTDNKKFDMVICSGCNISLLKKRTTNTGKEDVIKEWNLKA